VVRSSTKREGVDSSIIVVAYQFLLRIAVVLRVTCHRCIVFTSIELMHFGILTVRCSSSSSIGPTSVLWHLVLMLCLFLFLHIVANRDYNDNQNNRTPNEPVVEASSWCALFCLSYTNIIEHHIRVAFAIFASEANGLLVSKRIAVLGKD